MPSFPLSWHTVLAFSLLAWLTSATPGPAVLLALRNGATYGFRATLWSTLGNQLGLLVLATVSTLGLGLIMHHSAWLFTIIKWVGAGYLIFLGSRMLRSSKGFGLLQDGSAVDAHDPLPTRALMRTAMAVALTNPKAILFFGALFPQFVTPDEPALPQLLSLLALLVIASSSCLLGYGWLASHSRRWLQSPSAAKWINRVAGTVFILFGIGLVTLRLPGP